MRIFGRSFLWMCIVLSAMLPVQAQDASTNEKTPAQEITQLIDGGQLEEAAARIDQALVESPDDHSLQMLRRALAMRHARESQMELAVAQLERLVEYQLDRLDQEEAIANLGSSVQLLSSLLVRVNRTGDVMPLLERSIEALKPRAEGYTAATTGLSQLMRAKAGRMMSDGDLAAAQAIMADEVAKAKELLQSHNDTEGVPAHVITVIASYLPTVEGEKRGELLTEIESIASPRLEANAADPVLEAYVGVLLSSASQAARSEPEEAEQRLQKIESLLAAAKEANASGEVFPRFDRSIAALKRTIEGAKKLLALIGQPMPSFDAEHWVNGSPLSIDDLRGNVVLLDFWAVWCGPCIATFPHLKEWHQEYADDGLRIIGVTRRYNFSWDAEAKRAVRRPEGENSADEELAMLEQFVQHHELLHPSLVTPQESTMSEDYGVTGIPQAVLIDRQGKIRMIKVGSGEDNAKALHDMIQQLLAEEIN